MPATSSDWITPSAWAAATNADLIDGYRILPDYTDPFTIEPYVPEPEPDPEPDEKAPEPVPGEPPPAPLPEDGDQVGTAAADTLTASPGDSGVFGQGGNDTLYGTDGDDFLYGEAGDDRLFGRSDDDVLRGGGGDDLLVGGGGSDLFVFSAGRGNDVIRDFAPGEDLIDLSGLPGIDGLADLDFAASGDDLLIDAGSNVTIRLQNTAEGDIDADDFLF